MKTRDQLIEYLELLRAEGTQDLTVHEFRMIHGDPLAPEPRGTCTCYDAAPGCLGPPCVPEAPTIDGYPCRIVPSLDDIEPPRFGNYRLVGDE